MRRPFWPTTENGMFALRLSGLTYVLFAGLGMAPALLQILFQGASSQSSPGAQDSPAWYMIWFAPLASMGILGVCIAAGVLALIALVRTKDRGWGLYLAMVPMTLVVFFLVGELLILPFD